jgi:hypothetical protein
MPPFARLPDDIEDTSAAQDESRAEHLELRIALSVRAHAAGGVGHGQRRDP